MYFPNEFASDTPDSPATLLTHRLEFQNGIVGLITPNPTSDIIAARIFVDAGIRHEAENCWGLSHMVASTLTKGTTQRSAQAIAEIVESIGAGFGTNCAPDYFLVSLKTIREDFERIFCLAAEAIQAPSFPEHELEIERQIVLRAIAARQEQPLNMAIRPLQAAIHGPHPYAQTSLGTQATVEAFTQKTLQAFHQSHFRPQHTIISLAGNINLAEAEDSIQANFGDWQPPPAPVSPPVPPDQTISIPSPQDIRPQDVRPQDIRIDQNTQQSIIAFGYPAVSVHHPDHLGLKLLLTHLCGGMTSQLFVELREKLGLAYEVSGFYPTRLDPSHFVLYLGTSPAQTPWAFSQLQKELEKLSLGAFLSTDLNIAKQKLLGQYALSKQTNDQLAHLFGWHEILQLGTTYDQHFQAQIQDMSLADVQHIASQYLQNPIRSIVGPQEYIHFSVET